jgi:hypothetical protein
MYDTTTGFHTLRCLGGSDVTRTPTTLLVDVVGGTPYLASNYGCNQLRIVGETTLRGWGDLDGPAYDIQPDGVAWYVSVPVAEWNTLGKLKEQPTLPADWDADLLRKW